MASSLASNHSLVVDEPLISDDGTYWFVLQADGNLVLYKRIYDGSMRPLWASNTVGSGAISCSMQADGNLVLYDSAHHPKWASNTAGSTGSLLAIQDDGNAVIYRPNGSPAWATNTVDAPPLGDREHNKIEPAVREAIIAGFKGQEGNDFRQYLKYEGHGFWIHPLSTTRTSYGNKKITGRISHMLAGRIDDQIDFTLTYVGNKWLPPNVEIDEGGLAPILRVVLPISALVVGIVTANPLGFLAGAVAQAELARVLENKFTGDGWKRFYEMILTEIVIHSTPTLRFLWSSNGPFRTDLPFGYRAVKINEPAEPAEHSWGDNYLLIENVDDVEWAWSYAGPKQGDECVPFRESEDPHTWGDNYLCFKPKFGWEVRFSSAGPLDGYNSERILEASDPHTWGDNYLCWRKAPT